MTTMPSSKGKSVKISKTKRNFKGKEENDGFVLHPTSSMLLQRMVAKNLDSSRNKSKENMKDDLNETLLNDATKSSMWLSKTRVIFPCRCINKGKLHFIFYNMLFC